MSNLEKKRKKIFRTSLASIIITFLAFIFLIAGPFTMASTVNPIGFLALTILGVLSIIIASICGLVAAIRTLTFPKSHPEIDDKKIIFGILGIVLIGPLMPLIFSCIIKKYVEQVVVNEPTSTNML